MSARPHNAPTRATTTGNVSASATRNHSPQRNAMKRTTTIDDDSYNQQQQQQQQTQSRSSRHVRRSISLRPSASKCSKTNRSNQIPNARSERLRATLKQSLRRLSIGEKPPRKVQSTPHINHVSTLVDPSERATIYMQAADEAVRVGDILSAQEYLRDILRNCIDVSPHVTAEVLALLGIVADRLGHLKEAEILLNQSLGKSGDIQSFVPLYVLAGIYQRTGRNDEADRLLGHADKFRNFLVQ